MSHDANHVLIGVAELLHCDYCDALPEQKCWSKRAKINDAVLPHASRLQKTVFETQLVCSYCGDYTLANGVVRCRYKGRYHVCCPRCRRLFGRQNGTFYMRRCAEQLTEQDQALLALAGMGA